MNEEIEKIYGKEFPVKLSVSVEYVAKGEENSILASYCKVDIRVMPGGSTMQWGMKSFFDVTEVYPTITTHIEVSDRKNREKVLWELNSKSIAYCYLVKWAKEFLTDRGFTLISKEFEPEPPHNDYLYTYSKDDISVYGGIFKVEPLT